MALRTRKERGESPAYDLLYQRVEEYFLDGCTDFESKVRETSLSPIYFQHRGKPSISFLFSPLCKASILIHIRPLNDNHWFRETHR